MRNLISVIIFIATGLVGWQCTRSTEPAKQQQQSPTNRTPAQLTQDEKSLVESVNRFSFKLMRLVNQQADNSKNMFISPLSVSYALGIAYNGADGVTRSEMASALEINGFSIEEANLAYRGLTEILTKADPAVTFTIANSFWSRIGKEIVPEFTDVCRSYFNARVEEIDFQAPGAADTINNWVSENTNGKIKKIIQPPIPGSMAAILLNALYLKANWSYPFDTAHTRVRPFHLGDGSEVNCDMMSKKTEDDMQSFPEYSKRPIIYFETDLFQGATLPYGKEGFRMTVLLPDLSITVDSLVGLLTPENWQAWQQLPTWDDFVLQTPKFKFEFESRLNQVLQSLGMNAAFSGSQADFSNLFVDGVGWIDEVKHKTFVQVDEKGTEAAAVTSVIFFTSLPPSMIVNRPFVFVIYEATSGAILFMGKVVNPTQES